MNWFSTGRKKEASVASGGLNAPGEISWAIDDYFFLRGVFFVKGWVFHSGGAAVSISLRTATGEIVTLAPKPMARPDLLGIFGELAQNAGFHAAYVLSAEPSCSDVERMAVIFEAGGKKTGGHAAHKTGTRKRSIL